MYKYIFKRLLMLIPVIIALTFLIFALMTLSPGDPGTAILGTTAPPEAIRAFNENVGYYDPFLVRYGRFLVNLAHGSFGQSYATGKEVWSEIIPRMPTTLKVATFSMLFAVLVGVPMGVFSAVKQYSFGDEVMRVVSVTLAAVPGFWLALLLISIFAITLGLLPVYGDESWQHFVLPTIALGIPYSARQLRMTRSCMLETIRQDHIRTVRAKGAPESTVIWKHAFKNAMLPIMTQIGSNFGALIGGAVVTESVFAMTGLGTYLVKAVNSKDANAALGAAIVMSVSFSLVNLLVDFLYAVVDPRIKAKYK